MISLFKPYGSKALIISGGKIPLIFLYPKNVCDRGSCKTKPSHIMQNTSPALLLDKIWGILGETE